MENARKTLKEVRAEMRKHYANMTESEKYNVNVLIEGICSRICRMDNEFADQMKELELKKRESEGYI